MKTFERGALALAGLSVAGLVAAAVLHPPASATRAPKVQVWLAASVRIAPKPAAPPRLEVLAGTMAGASARTLARAFSRLGYDLDAVVSGNGPVPRFFLGSVPTDMAAIREMELRKAVFFRAVLPIVLQVNEEIAAERARLWRIKTRLAMGRRLDAVDRLWLIVLAKRYGVRRGDLDSLLAHVDVIPPSLALAQAAEESGWGTSRFAREGNAIFGQWVNAGQGGLTPKRRDAGKSHAVGAFPTLLDGARAYARNLNSHRAYTAFRQRRAEMRHAGRRLDGARLAGELSRYSARGRAYVGSIRRIIGANGLGALDGARLADGPRLTPSI